MRPADILVIGAGTAGMPCAIAAAQAGAHVVVVEKTDDLGGTLNLSAGSMAAAGTRRQRERGIEDTVEEHLADLERIGGGLADPTILRRAAELAPDAIDWLDELGFAFDDPCPVIYHGYEPYGKSRVYWGKNLARSAIEVMEPLWTAEVERGAITPLFGHALIDLIVEDDAVVGARARDAEGVVIDIHAPAVVLATGGYGANPELYAELTPDAPRLVSATRAASTGDGLTVARAHGGAIRQSDLRIATPGGIEQEPGSGLCDWWDGFANLDADDRPPREIHVNVHGRRFIAEDDPSPHRRHVALSEQPDRSLWVVFGEAALDGSPLVLQWSADELRRRAREGRYCWTADDPATLATLAGIDPDGLATTIVEWNAAVDAGHDPLGRRNPGPRIEAPLYALRTHATALFTFAGLRVDADLRVLDETDTPLPGLYAAGEIIGGATTSGGAFCTGMLVTPAIAFGRDLGRRLGATVRA